MKFIKTAIPNRYVNADSILELSIEKGGEIISEREQNCYKILALVQSQQYPLVLGSYDSLKGAEIALSNLAKNLSSTRPYEMR